MHTSSGRSLWTDTMPDDELVSAARPTADLDVDVAIIGAGYTGLWTALHLQRRDPGLRVAVLERASIGFGASGRNGGWCSALLPMSLDAIATRHGSAAATRMQQAMYDNVGEVAAFAESHAPEGVLHHGGTLSLARNAAQLQRLQAHAAELERFGLAAARTLLTAAEASEHCRATRVVGGAFTPHCATVHPLRLVHAVARAAIAAGATIYEGVTVEEIDTGAGRRARLRTDTGTVRADVVVQATEGYTSQLPGQRRALLPIYSLMIATEPLDESAWAEIGLDGRPTFNDGRNLIIYGQRTADGRIAFGGRGAPYHFGSTVRPEFDTHERVRQLLSDTLRDLFPPLATTRITHHWGGALGAPRDWTCSVRFDRSAGFASGGGYVGDGVGTAHLAGRTLAALITDSDDDQDRELVRLPWVGHRSRRWEPEPLRWIGVNAIREAARRADIVEHRHGRSSRLWGKIVSAATGH